MRTHSIGTNPEESRLYWFRCSNPSKFLGPVMQLHQVVAHKNFSLGELAFSRHG